MKQKFLFLIVLIFLYESALSAQNKYTFSQFGSETVDFVKMPLRWGGDDYIKFGLVGVGTGLIMFADQQIRDAVLRDRRYYHSAAMELGRMYGEYYSPIVFFAGFASYSLIMHDITARKIAYEIGQASLYSGGLTFLLKVSIGRARPYLEKGPGTYRPFSSIFNQDYHSIPGGHSTAAFAVSTVLSRNVQPVWLKVLCYVPPLFTMVSRVYQDQHWSSDNFMGAALGYFVATWVVDKHEKTAATDTKGTQHGLMDRIQFQPTMSGDCLGINLNIPLL